MSRSKTSLYVPRSYPSTPESEALAQEVEDRVQKITARQLGEHTVRGAGYIGEGMASIGEGMYRMVDAVVHPVRFIRDSIHRSRTDEEVLALDTEAPAGDWQAVGDDLRSVIPSLSKEEEQ